MVFPLGCRPQQEELLIELRDGFIGAVGLASAFFTSLPAQAKANNVCCHGAAATNLQCSLIVKGTIPIWNLLPSACVALIGCETAGGSVLLTYGVTDATRQLRGW